MNTKKHMSLLVVLAMIVAYAIPFGGVFAADASWSASADVTADTELMAGLTPMIDLTYTAKDRSFEDTSSFSGYISHADTSGGWSGGVATGTALKYEASENGTLTVYVADVKNKTVYLIEEGAAESKSDLSADVALDSFTEEAGTSTHVILTGAVEAGHTYYAFVSGSKGRFCGAKFVSGSGEATETTAPDVTEEPTTEPTVEPVVTVEPTAEPTVEPDVTIEPTAEPTVEPVVTVEPTAEPTVEPVVTVEPTAEPTVAPTVAPTQTEKPEEELSADEIAVRKDAQALLLKAVSQTAVYFDIDLDKKGSNGSKITWESSNTDYIDIQTLSHINRNYTGVVKKRPMPEECDETGGVPVTLTATLTKGDAVYTKTFDVSVRAWNPMYYNDFQADVGKAAEDTYGEIADGVKAANGDTFRGIRIDTLKESRCFEAFGHNDKDVPQYFDKRVMSTEDYDKPRGVDENEENFAFYYNEYKSYGGTSTNPLWIKLIDPETGSAPEGIVMLSMDIYVITGEQKFNIGFGTSKASQMCRFLLGSGKSSSLGYDGAGYIRLFSNISSIDFMGGTGGYRHPTGEWVRAVLVANSETHKWDFYYDGMQIGSGLDFRNAEDVIPTIEFTMDRNTVGGSYFIDNIYVENLTEDYRETYWDAYVPDTLVYDEELETYVVENPFLLQYQGTDGIAGSYFTWTSSDSDVLSIKTQRIAVDELVNYGYTEAEVKSLKDKGYEDVSVNLATPGNIAEDTYVTLTAKLEIGDTINKKDFKVLVKANATQNATGDSAKALEDANAISSVKNGASVSSDLTLPTKGSINGSTITWKSSNEKVISTTGEVTRPTGTSAVDVTLTATVKYGDAVQYKKFTVKVAPKSSGNNGGGGGGSGSGGGGGVIANDAQTPAQTTAPAATQKPAQPINPVTGLASFTDLYKAQWAREAIEYLFSKDIVNGYGDGTYGVNDDVTREQFVRMLLTALNIKLPETENNKFTDVVSDTWYTNYVNGAWVMGIVSGVSETEFGVGQPISRQDMAVMCMRALDYVNKHPEQVIEDAEEVEETEAPTETETPEEAETPEETETPEEAEAPEETEEPAETEIPEETEVTIDISDIPFADKDEIADYALEAVARMAQAGYLSGDENGNFAPKKTSTRAETAVVLYRILIQEDL